jgi:hypothetical protein
MTLAIFRYEWSDSRSCRLPPGEKTPYTHFVGGWVDSSDRLDDVNKKKIFIISGLNSELPVVHTVASCYIDCAIAALTGM